MSSARRPFPLCDLDEIGDPGAKGFDVQCDGERVRVFVVRKAEVLAAYLNSCPHTGVPLEWLPDQFLDPDSGFIQCATHGALFRPEDGYCLRGPCSGRSLTPLQVHVEGNRIAVSLPPQGD